LDTPHRIFHDAVYPLLERPLPGSAPTRLDYFFRDSLACQVSTPEVVARLLDHLTTVEGTIAFNDLAIAREARALFAEIESRLVAARSRRTSTTSSPTRCARVPARALSRSDLLSDDAHVLARPGPPAAPDRATLDRIEHFRADRLAGYVPRVIPRPDGSTRVLLNGSGSAGLSECL